jgi:hypothetical protein
VATVPNPAGEAVTVAVKVTPWLTVGLAGVEDCIATRTLAGTTCVGAVVVNVEPLKFGSPLYAAVTVRVPADAKAPLQVAVPVVAPDAVTRFAVQRIAAEVGSVKVTEPPGDVVPVSEEGVIDTLAVNVTS